ncbi:unnamed protein product [Leptidea sinapis]|uniref:Uncharacterized protein n=1 Tax=Leptidea sinapis TaxID=189913 RepID=A0A5E4QFS4_9NEOP|nr:unnamed protein product [Leptidea sinapis]
MKDLFLGKECEVCAPWNACDVKTTNRLYNTTALEDTLFKIEKKKILNFKLWLKINKANVMKLTVLIHLEPQNTWQASPSESPAQNILGVSV